MHLVHAEQRAGGQHGRMRQAALVAPAAGEATATDGTPATWAGTTFMTTDEG